EEQAPPSSSEPVPDRGRLILFGMPDRRGAVFVEKSVTNEGRTPRKLYANASYGPPWPGENRPRELVERADGRFVRHRNSLVAGPVPRSVIARKRLGGGRGCAPGRVLAPPGDRLHRGSPRRGRRSTYGSSRGDGKPPGMTQTSMSRERIRRGPSGTRRSRLRT